MERMAVPVPAALRERLGEEAARQLGEMMGEPGVRWRDQVLEVATERFGRMLAEEAGRLRVDIVNLRGDMAVFEANC